MNNVQAQSENIIGWTADFPFLEIMLKIPSVPRWLYSKSLHFVREYQKPQVKHITSFANQSTHQTTQLMVEPRSSGGLGLTGLSGI